MAKAFYSDPDPQQRNAAQQALSGLTGDIPTLLLILRDSTSEYSHMFVALSLVSAFKAQKGNLTKKQQEEVMEQLYSRIIAPSTIGYTAQHLMFALCKITKLVFELESTMNPVVIDVALGIITSPGALMTYSNEMITTILRLLAEMIEEFNLFDSSKSNTYMTFVQHRRASNNFRDKCLLNIFAAALGLLDLCTPETPGLDCLCKIIKSSLNYDFMAIMIDETEETMTTQIPSAWKPYIFSSTIDSLWKKHLTLPPPFCSTLLWAIAGLCGVRRSFFDGNSEKIEFLEKLISHLCHAWTIKDGRLSYPDYTGALADAMNRLTPPFAYRDLIQCPSYLKWLEALSNFSLGMFQIPFGAEGSYMTTNTLLSCWSRLISSRRMHVTGSSLGVSLYSQTQESPPEEEEAKQEPQDLEVYVPQLAGTYFQCRLYDSPSADFDSEAVDSIISQSEQFSALVSVSPGETMLNILRAAEAVGGPAVIKSESGYCWLLYLVSYLVRSTLHNNAESAGSLYTAVLQFTVACIRERQASRIRPTDTIETAMVTFLSSVQNTFGSKHLSEGTKKILAAVFESPDKLFQFVLTTVGHNMVNPSSNPAQIIRQSITLIADAARDAPSSARKSLQISLPPVVQMPLAQSASTYKLRTALYNALFALQLPDPYSQDDFLAFMRPIEELMQQSLQGVGSGSDPLFIAGWLRDLRGVAESAAESLNAFTDFVDWIVERSQIFIQLSQTGTSPLVVISLLRLLKQLVSPNRSGRVNLPSACHCPSGVILFKFIAQCVQNIISVNLNPERLQIFKQGGPIPDGAYTMLLKPVFLSMQICKNCVTGEFCPFGAMAMYNDSTFDTLVVGLFRFLAAFPFTLFQQYHKASAAFADLLRTLVESQITSPLAAMDSGDFVAIIQLCLNLADDVDTKTATLLYTLQFLAFIAGLYRLVLRQLSGQPRSPTLSPTKSSTRHNETIAALVAPFTDLWIHLACRTMSIVQTQDRALSAVNSVVFPLFDANSEIWNAYCLTIMEAAPSEKRPELQKLLLELAQGLSASDRFFSALFTFRSKIRHF